MIVVNTSINPVYADFKPKPSPPPKTNAQGTRGCPTRLGELALFGIGTTEQDRLTIDITFTQPLLLYQVVSEQSEKLLLTITEVESKFKRNQIYEQKVAAVNSNYKVLNLPKLDPSKKYLVTLVLLCQDRPQYGKTIHAWLNIIEGQTQVNTFIQSQNINEVQQNNP